MKLPVHGWNSKKAGWYSLLYIESFAGTVQTRQRYSLSLWTYSIHIFLCYLLHIHGAEHSCGKWNQRELYQCWQSPHSFMLVPRSSCQYMGCETRRSDTDGEVHLHNIGAEWSSVSNHPNMSFSGACLYMMRVYTLNSSLWITLTPHNLHFLHFCRPSSPFSSASSVCVLLCFCPFHPFFFFSFSPCPLQLFLPSFQILLESSHVYSSLSPPLPLSNTFKPFPAPLWFNSSIHALRIFAPWAASACCYPQSACPNLPSRMMMHSRMAIRAPVLRPAEERNASPWHIRVLPWRWHGHTRSVKVLVPLSDGSPLSQTTMGSSYSSWVRWLKRRRLAMMLAVLSTEGWGWGGIKKKEFGYIRPYWLKGLMFWFCIALLMKLPTSEVWSAGLM